MAFASASSGTRAAVLRLGRTVLVPLTVVFAFAEAASAEEAAPGWDTIGALFRERCVMCHSREAAARGLRLDTYAGAIAGSGTGPVLIPGDPPSSELIRRLNGASRPRMPFLSYPLSSAEIDLVERWIAAGLPETVPPTFGVGSD